MSSNTDYMCWRVSGQLSDSIQSCPTGKVSQCFTYEIGNMCLGGHEIVL